jgi:stearoyl-CoA desaturase (delta-9 desaturase)
MAKALIQAGSGERRLLTGPPADSERMDYRSSLPFLAVHLIALAAPFVTGFSKVAIGWAVGMYALRMFAITAGFHRYFSHRTYKTSRPFQFVLAVLGTLSVQKGVLWWAAHHRHHHRFADQEEDIHSPQRGFFWSHVGWVLCRRYNRTEYQDIRDFAKYPELRWLNRYHLVVVVAFAAALFWIGGWTALLWGFFVSTALLWHGTYTINSLAHVFGRRRYATSDTSRNSLLLALLTFGEGWHNNHHYYQSATCQGFYWWEIDLSYYILKLLSWCGLVWDLRRPPRQIRAGQGIQVA